MAHMNLSQAAVKPGDLLDHYRIESVVAESAVATVFRGSDVRNASKVAIKIPHPNMQSDPAFVDRFTREIKIGEVLDHPNIMKVIAVPDRTGIYMVMEWFEGKTLREILKQEGKLAADRAGRIAGLICEALEYIQRQGFVHGDIRPENVMVGAGDSVKLIDFGGAIKASARRLTMAGLAQAGGPSKYISPEELVGKRGEARSDIYSLGVLLYEMLTGKFPFQGAALYDRITNYPVPPREVDPAISPQLQEVLYRALERDPQKRYANAHDFARDLGHLDQVGIADRPELRDWQRKRGKKSKQYVLYALIVLIPIAIFGLLLYMARH
jgi:eukaryotic-like serine/threonine-protein kinase